MVPILSVAPRIGGTPVGIRLQCADSAGPLSREWCSNRNGRKPIFCLVRVDLNTRERDIEDLITPAVEALGCELWGIEFMSMGRHSKLRIYIDREDGVNVGDCERVSREVSDLLDVENLVPQAYTLEISSPGMDRILFKPEHYTRHIGETVDIRLHFPYEGSKRVTGVLAGLEDDEVILQAGEDEFILPLENIQRARLVPRFD
jgi:ribosome maturation factor RimP